MHMRKRPRLDIDTRHERVTGPPSVVATLDLATEIKSPLLVPELFYNILDCFDPIADPDGKQTLASLAQTCRAFTDSALDRLWKRLHSLKPLIRCYTTPDEFENEAPPTIAQFAIIDRYSHRIRELTIADETSVRFLKCTSMQPCLLLPNLTSLEWSPYVLKPHVPIIFIQRLLSPTLLSLEANLAEEDGPILLSFFETYPISCQDLKSIEFRFSNPTQSESTVRALSRAICSQKALESVIVHGLVDESALTRLCTSPMLKLLSVHLPDSSTLKKEFLSTDSLLCNAEELEFTTSDLDLVSSLLRPRNQKFHSLGLYHRGRQTSEAVVNFLNLLTSRPPSLPLQKLTLSIGDICQPVPVDRMPSEAILYRLSYKTLQPLMLLSSLRELMIEWSEQTSLDDTELRNLARCWPALQTFHLHCGRGGYPPFSAKYPTLRGLLSLVGLCPQLSTVSLPLDAREVPAVTGEGAHETDFACLTVPESPIDEPLPVAEFFCRYLPSVTAIEAKFMRPPGTDIQQIIAYEHAWQQVDVHLEEHYNSSLDAWGSGSGSDSGSDSDVHLDVESDVESDG